MGVAQPQQQVLLRVEQPVDEHGVALELGDVGDHIGDFRHQVVRHVERRQVVTNPGVDVGQSDHHQGVVGHVTVSLVQR